jgi:amino acid adenylation domain-containing protein
MSSLSERLEKLSPQQRDRLRKKLRSSNPDADEVSSIPKRDQDGPYPLSPSQERLWLIEQIEPNNYGYNVSTAVRFEGDLDAATLRRALADVTRRHESLRTVFRSEDGGPVQVVKSSIDVSCPVVDLRGLSDSVQAAAKERIFVTEARRPFDLETGPLLHPVLLRLAPDRHILFMTLHHIVGDGWSQGVVIRELYEIYEARVHDREPDLEPLCTQFVDFALWERERLDSVAVDEQLAYWCDHLDGAPSELRLPHDSPRPDVRSYRGRRHPVRIAAETVSALRSISQEANATLFMTLLAVYYATLSRFSPQSDFVVGSPIANRQHTDVENVVGFFVNTLALRVQVDGSESFWDLLARVRSVVTDAFNNQDVPFAEVVKAVRSSRDLRSSPVFQTMFLLDNTPHQRVELPNVSVEPLEVDGRVSMYDLSLSLETMGQEIQGAFEYNTDLFTASTIDRIAQAYQMLLDRVLDEPDAPLGSLPVVPLDSNGLPGADAGRSQQSAIRDEVQEPKSRPVRNAENVGRGPRDREEEFQSVLVQIQHHARERPDAAALVKGRRTLTYAAVWTQAQSLAGHLQSIDAFHETPEPRVGVLGEPSLESVVAMTAIFQTGATYVPLDPTYPDVRLRFLVEDAGLECLLTGVTDRRPAWLPPDVPVVDVNASAEGRTASPADPPSRDPEIDPSTAAYQMYTSGTTGEPKGVVVDHRSLAHYTQQAQSTYNLSSRDRTYQYASPSFDISIEEIVPTLAAGATLVLDPEARMRSPDAVLDEIRRQAVTVTSLPTAFWHLVVDRLDGRDLPPSLRCVVIGGERARDDQLAAWCDQVSADVDLYNTYGPTETTVVVTVRPIHGSDGDEGEPVSGANVGWPLPGVSTYVLNEWMRPVPTGVSGELFVGGPQVAREYHGRPRETAARFVPNPLTYSDHSREGRRGLRLYRTGDRVVQREDGSIAFQGRMDAQMKVRGHRIEPEEVEIALNDVDGVAGAAVTTVTGDGDRKRLAAFLVTRSESLPVDDVRAALEPRLPEHMIPSVFVQVDEIPTTPNGKIDRSALGGVDSRSEGIRASGTSDQFVPPETPLERALCAIWERELGVDRVGVRDDFFALGGHSLLAMQLISHVDEYFGVGMSLRSFFQAPTITGMKNALCERADEGRLRNIASAFLEVL